MLNVTCTERGPLDHKVKAIRQIVNQAFSDGVQLWHRNMLPGHFTTQEQFAAGYGSHVPGGFVKRGKKYMVRKARVYGHQRNLEFSGELRRNVTTQIVISQPSFTFGAKGRLPGSQKANLKRSAASPDMRAELLVTTPDEDARLAKAVEYLIAQQLGADAPVIVTNVGVVGGDPPPQAATWTPAPRAAPVARAAGRPEI